MRKIISPLVYILFFLIDYVLIFLIWDLIEIRAWGYSGWTIITLTIIVTIIVLWLENMVAGKIEKLLQPKTVDHFRQSGILYIVLMVLIYFLVGLYSTHRYGLEYIHLVVTAILSFLMIVINILYLWRMNK